jgi:hypothetical protein
VGGAVSYGEELSNLREEKARDIAVLLRSRGVCAAVACRMDQDGRRSAGELTGHRRPSPTTWRMVLGFLVELEEESRQVLAGVALRDMTPEQYEEFLAGVEDWECEGCGRSMGTLDGVRNLQVCDNCDFERPFRESEPTGVRGETWPMDINPNMWKQNDREA